MTHQIILHNFVSGGRKVAPNMPTQQYALFERRFTLFYMILLLEDARWRHITWYPGVLYGTSNTCMNMFVKVVWDRPCKDMYNVTLYFQTVFDSISSQNFLGVKICLPLTQTVILDVFYSYFCVVVCVCVCILICLPTICMFMCLCVCILCWYVCVSICPSVVFMTVYLLAFCLSLSCLSVCVCVGGFEKTPMPAASIRFSDWGGGGGGAKVRKIPKFFGVLSHNLTICAAKMKIVYV